MATYKGTAFETVYNDGATGRFRTGQVAGIGSDDFRTFTTDAKDSFANRLEINWKATVRMATTAALPSNTLDGTGQILTATANGALAAQDGVTPTAGDRILVWREADQKKNGVFTVTQVGTGSTPYILTRATDSDTTATLHAGIVPIGPEGTVYKHCVFRQTTANPTINTSNIAYICQNRPVIVTVTSATTLAVLAEENLIIGDTTGSAFTSTLPSASGIAGVKFICHRTNAGANNWTIGGTVNGTVNPTHTSQYQVRRIVSTGSAWIEI